MNKPRAAIRISLLTSIPVKASEPFELLDPVPEEAAGVLTVELNPGS